MRNRLAVLVAVLSALLCLATIVDRMFSHRSHHYAGLHPSHVDGPNRITREAGLSSYDGVVVLYCDAACQEARGSRPFPLFNWGTGPTRGWSRSDTLLQRAGFMCEHRHMVRGGGFTAIWADTYDVVVPHWFLALLLAVWPATVWLHHRRRARWPAGRCNGCGYDLRASPDRCPECGRTTGVNRATA